MSWTNLALGIIEDFAFYALSAEELVTNEYKRGGWSVFFDSTARQDQHRPTECRGCGKPLPEKRASRYYHGRACRHLEIARGSTGYLPAAPPQRAFRLEGRVRNDVG